MRRILLPVRLLMALAFFFLVLAGANAALAEEASAIAMRGTPKYAPGFPHLNYVNPDAPKGGTLRVGALGSFDSLNEYIIKGQAAAGMRDLVQESLLARSYDEPFTLYGLLAQTIEVPDDRSSIAFTLRAEAKFSDGSPVTPDDVLFSWALLRDKGRPNNRKYYAKVKLAERVGENGVRFVFDTSGDREMPLIMGLMPIFSKRATNPDTFEKTSFEPLLGTGPYTVAGVMPGQSVEFKRNPNYWGKDLSYNRGQYNFNIVHYDYYRDLTTMMEAFRNGLFDEMAETDPVQWAMGYDFPAARNGEVKKLEFELATPAPMTALVFNTRKPLFADIRVRKALNLLFDFEWINKALFHGLYKRTESFFDRSELSSHGRAADTREEILLAPFKGDLAPEVLNGTFAQPATDGSGTNRQGRRQAIALLGEAGYVLKNGVMVAKATGEPLTFEMLVQSRDQERLMLAYSGALEQSGIKATIRVTDSAQYQRRITSFDFDMIQATWQSSLSPGNEQSFRWSSSVADQDGSFNYPGIKSAAADAMIQALLSAKTQEDFTSAVRALDRVLLSGGYVIPLFYIPKQWIAARSYLRQPQGSTLYGARPETWWMDPKRVQASSR